MRSFSPKEGEEDDDEEDEDDEYKNEKTLKLREGHSHIKTQK